ncbi:F-box/LRR-repeat protein 25-like protein [Tanacetum coccineum]
MPALIVLCDIRCFDCLRVLIIYQFLSQTPSSDIKKGAGVIPMAISDMSEEDEIIFKRRQLPSKEAASSRVRSWIVSDDDDDEFITLQQSDSVLEEEGVFEAEAEMVDYGGEIEVQNPMNIFSSEDEEEFDTDSELNKYRTKFDDELEETLKEHLLKLHHVKELRYGISCSRVISRLQAKGFSCPSNLNEEDEDVISRRRYLPKKLFHLDEECSRLSEVVDNGGEIEVQNQMTIFSSQDEEEFGNEAAIVHAVLTDSEVSDCPICPVTPPIRVSDANHLNENMEEEEGEDRISALPDCLNLEILSRLPKTKEAIKTSSLSKRWQYVWTSVPNLVFIHDAPYNDLYAPLRLPYFFTTVDHTLAQCRQVNLNRFLLNTRYETAIESQLRNWICHVINCSVQDLQILLHSRHSCSRFDFCNMESFFINSCFTNLKLACCIFHPTGAISWNNLTSLSISRGKLNEVVIQNILSGSPRLETFEWVICYGFTRLDINSKSVKKLVLIDHSLNKYRTKFDDEVEEALKEHLPKLHHVKELRYGISCSRVISRLQAKGFSCPSNLKMGKNRWIGGDIDMMIASQTL